MKSETGRGVEADRVDESERGGQKGRVHRQAERTGMVIVARSVDPWLNKGEQGHWRASGVGEEREEVRKALRQFEGSPCPSRISFRSRSA